MRSLARDWCGRWCRCRVLGRTHAAARATGLAMLAVWTAFAAAAPPAIAESMRAALRAAYMHNPEIDAERARLRAVDEDVQRAKSGWAPTINGNASMAVSRTRSSPGSNQTMRPKDLGVSLSQPVFTGFRTYYAVHEAEALVRAGRGRLREVEGRVLAAAARAYLDVMRDRQLMSLEQSIVGVLTRELNLTKGRERLGEVTLTDVDQARMRRARAVVELEAARGELRGSEADYQRLIGHAAPKLRGKGVVLGDLPKTLAQALSIARDKSPLVEFALYREQAARHAVSKERGDLMPRVDVEADYTKSYGASVGVDHSDSARVIGRLSVPIYNAGETRARIRQSKHLHVSRLQEVEQARRQAEADVRTAWGELMAARGKVRSDKAQIRYAKAALKGVREEERLGQRTLLNVLNAEEEVFDAKRDLLRSQRDIWVAHYELLLALGQLDGGFLALARVQYDPEQHYHEAKSKWITTSITRAPLSRQHDRAASGPARKEVQSWPAPRLQRTAADAQQAKSRTSRKPRSAHKTSWQAVSVKTSSRLK